MPAPFTDIVVRSTIEPVSVELYNPYARPGVDPPIMRCTAPCRAHVPVGRYKLYVAEGPENLSGSRAVDVSGPSTVVVDPDKPSQRTIGLVLGIGGVVAMISGAVLVLSGSCWDDGYCNHSDDGRSGAGAFLLLSGVVATPIGWVMFGKSFKPEVTTTPAGPQFGLAPALLPSPHRALGSAPDAVPGLVLSGRF